MGGHIKSRGWVEWKSMSQLFKALMDGEECSVYDRDMVGAGVGGCYHLVAQISKDHSFLQPL